MKAALIQAPLIWEDAQANRNYFTDKIDSITESVDLIALPEMFTTGFTMNPLSIAETMNGTTVAWMKSIAGTKQSAICGSIVIKEKNGFFNRFLFVLPSGAVHYYDKKHLFSLAGEDKAYVPGKDKLIIDYKGFRICPMVCYDLRFPAFSRNLEDFDLLIYVANWPKPRISAWDTLLKARAIENMCYVVGVNRIGEDSNGLEYIGHSQVIDYLGESLIAPEENEGIFITKLDKAKMLETRKKFGFLNDRDHITVT